jgi:hypothetical protein
MPNCIRLSVVLLFLVTLLASLVNAAPIHGLWVWKSPTVLEAPNAAESLIAFCKAQGINELYVSISERSEAAEENQLVNLIELAHGAHIRVEALLSSTEADESGKHRDTLLRHVQGIVEFNRRHRGERFDGIHLDLEPWQRPENKGSGNLRFLPGLAEAYRAVCSLALPAGLSVNADILGKLLKGDHGQRDMLLSSVPRVTLMMYELSSPNDGDSPEQKAEKVQQSSQKFLDMAYEGLTASNLARMVVALRTPDYNDLLPRMLQTLDDANRSNPHYLGWARHSYNDTLKPTQ